MGRFDTIKTTIDANIKQNGNQEITGQILNSVLSGMMDSTDTELTGLETQLGFDAGLLIFEPKNNTLTKKQLLAPKVRKGKTYQISILNKGWDISGVTAVNGVGFGVGYFPKGSASSNYVNLVSVPVKNLATLADEYTIEVTDDWDMLNIEVRASERVYVKVEDITNVSKLETELEKNAYKSAFVGVGTAYTSNQIYGLIAGHTYKIVLQETNWDKPTVSGSPLGFNVAYFLDGVQTNLVSVGLTSEAAKQYTFTLPNSFDYVAIGGRALSGVKVRYNIEDITDVVDLESNMQSQINELDLTVDKKIFTANITSSSKSYFFPISLKSGVTYKVKCIADGVITDATNVSCPFYYNDSSHLITELFTNGKEKEFTPTEDVTQLYIYVTAAAFLAAGNISIELWDIENNLTDRITELEYVTEGLILETNVSTPSKTYTLPCSLKSGEEYILKLRADGVITHTAPTSCPLYYNSTSNLIDHDFTNGKEIFFTPTEDVTSLMLYVTVAAFIAAGEISIMVYSKDGLLNDISSLQKTSSSFETLVKDTDVMEHSIQFCSLLNVEGDVEPFIFFTDPHLYYSGVSYEKRNAAISLLRQYYNNLPVNFILCGGDWLTNHKQSDALQYLGEIDGMMNGTFKSYYPVFGNHDNNYQGGIEDETLSDGDDGVLSNQVMTNLWFREYGKMYYSFKGTTTRFIVLDTGIDWESAMTAYRWEQVDWLAELLLNQVEEHNVIAMHIVSNGSATFQDGITPMAEAVTQLCNAFNNRSSIVLNGKEYNFTAASGKVHIVICGHSHQDYAGQINGIPILCTTQFLRGYTGIETFDLVVLDYANNQLNSVRVGYGSNRQISLA